MKNRIKVLQLQPNYNVKPNDASDLAEQIVKGLPAEQYEVFSGYLSGRPTSTQPSSIAEHIEYFDLKEKDVTGLRLKAMWKLYRFCQKNRPDVIICNRFKVISLVLQLNKIMRVPLCIGIAHSMDEYKRKYRQLQVKLLADQRWRFVGVSETVREKLIAYHSGFKTNNTVTIQNAIDIDKVATQQLEKHIARERLGLPQDAIIVGALGRLVAVKGHRYLISAFARIKDEFPSARLAIIGNGKEEGALNILIKESNIIDRVNMLGWRDNAAQYAKAFDIWTLPSLQEGLPLALMEGMAGRLPLIASDIPQLRHIILGAGGIAVKPKDVDGLAEALRAYLSMDIHALQQKGEYGFRYLVKHHGINHYRQSYRQLIETTLNI
ncbi:glycosyltransferase [Methylobacillus sp. Pita1]|uniref:glycosyltransferase n=1 Tax=Methylobacillus sp. Pita1 TaxID=3382642 RepID=UPI0038B51B18